MANDVVATPPPVNVPPLRVAAVNRDGSNQRGAESAAFSPSATRPELPLSGDSQVWTPRAKSASLRVARTPRAASPRDQAAGSPLPLREGSVIVADDVDALRRLDSCRRLGEIDDPAAVSEAHPDGHTWLHFRVRMPDGRFVLFFSDVELIALLRRFAREHRREYEVDGPNAGRTVTCICAQGPAVFSFTLSFMLYALEQPEVHLRHDALLLREPSVAASGREDAVEWIEIPTAAFCQLAREGLTTEEMAIECVRDVSAQLADDGTLLDDAAAAGTENGDRAAVA